MIVKIGDKYFSSNNNDIILIMTSSEKEFISEMNEEEYKAAFYNLEFTTREKVIDSMVYTIERTYEPRIEY